MQNLTLIMWTDVKNKPQRLDIVPQVSDKYRDIALLLGLNIQELDNYMHMSNNDRIDCCCRIFSKWIENNGHPPMYPKSWDGLCQLLYSIKKCSVVVELKKILAIHGISVNQCNCDSATLRNF